MTRVRRQVGFDLPAFQLIITRDEPSEVANLLNAEWASSSRQCRTCKSIMSDGCIMLSFRLLMIHSEPATTRNTMRMPNASASTLLVLSGPVVMCRKKTRVHTHLRDGEHDKAERDAGRPDQRRVGHPEGGGGEGHGEGQTDRVDAHVGQRPLSRLGRYRDVSGGAIVACVGHGRTPIR